MAISDDQSLQNNATKKDYSSQLKPYSLGILTANKGQGTELIDVMLIELSWATNGEINNNYTQETVEGLNDNGEKIKYSIVSSNNITATWLPLGNSNRISPPELRRGMIVLVYKDSDNNYYWVDSGFSRELMRAETVTYAYCANGNSGKNEKVSQDCWYIMEVSPRTHQVMLSTSNANGEYTTYDILLNTKEGYLKINDGLGNLILMDSKNIWHKLENQKGTYIEMLNMDINMYAPNNINIEAKNEVNIKSGSNVNYNCGANVNYTIAGNYMINARGNYNVNSVSYNLNPTSGSGAANGDIIIDGKMESNTVETHSDIHAGGNITAGGKIDCKH